MTLEEAGRLIRRLLLAGWLIGLFVLCWHGFSVLEDRLGNVEIVCRTMQVQCEQARWPTKWDQRPR